MAGTGAADPVGPWSAMAAGAASVALGAGLGELLAAAFLPASGGVAAVGDALIDLAPAWAKDAAIALFGTGDKLALVIGIAVVLLIAAGVAGLLEARRPPWGVVLLLVLGAVGAVSAVTRADADVLAWLPAVLSAAIAAVALHALLRARRRTAKGDGTGADSGPRDAGRRRFFAWTGAAAAAGVLAAIGGVALRAGAQAVESVRAALRLPPPAVPAPAPPASADLGIPGLDPLVTPNRTFYRIDKALVVPEIDPAEWKLQINGMVEETIVITWDELLALPLEESWVTLACVSNPVGGDLVGTAKWLGYPVRHLLARARPLPGADMVLSHAWGGFSASTPLEALTDPARPAILAVGMNGEPLPAAHGFPVRMVVSGLYGYVSATKWVTALEVTRFDRAKAYWTDRGWSERGPVKLQSRIDVPRAEGGLAPGDTVIAGVAWQQHVGIAGVEVQVDDGPWRAATLATTISDDTWVQWSIPWTATAGSHTLRCRATNALGQLQTHAESPADPDGATGWHRLVVSVV